MYSHNGYFHPIAAVSGAAASFQPLPQLMFQTEGLSSNDERINFLNEQMLLNDAKTIEAYMLEETSAQQVKQMCVVMEKQGSLEECLKLLNKLESTQRHRQTDPVLKLKCKVLYDQSQFEALYQIIQTHHFSRDYHRDLQSLWNDAHYKETENVRGGKGLDPVSRYRVRRKHAYPRTIWDGEGTSYCFKKRDRKILKEAYERNCMPNQAEKQALAQKTELNVTQVSNWFKNQRQRARQHQKEKCVKRYASSVSDDYIESEREDSGRSGNSGSRGSNPISEEDDHSMQHGVHSINLMPGQQAAQLPSSSLANTLPVAISSTSTDNFSVTDPQLNVNGAVPAATNFYNNYNFSSHFENFWPATSVTTPAAANPFSAQMYYPFGVYSYTNYPTYPTVYPPASHYIKMMNSDLTTPAATNQMPAPQNENSQYAAFAATEPQQNTTSKYLKYETSNIDYHNL